MTTKFDPTKTFTITNPKATRFHHVMSFTVIIEGDIYYECVEQCDYTSFSKITKEEARESYRFYKEQGFLESKPRYTGCKRDSYGRVTLLSN